MKVSPEHLNMLVEAIRPLSDKIIPHANALPTSARPPKNLPMRVRWDAFWAAKIDASPMYAYGCNDEHIDTALREVMRQLGFPQFAAP